MRYFFRVEYTGTRFGGWQNQPNCITVQQLIEEALTIVLRAPCSVTGAGRTDAGVHARGQGAHFDAPEGADINTGRLTAALNALLPYDIAVYGMTPVSPDFHARYSASSRLYKYYFTVRKSPLNYNRAWRIEYAVDWRRVKREMECLLGGQREYTAFCSSKTDTDNMMCSIKRVSLTAESGMKVFIVEADRFIYKMVRSLAGTLVDIGRGRLVDTLDAIIASKDRKRAGETAPACGLVLERVFYPAGCVSE